MCIHSCKFRSVHNRTLAWRFPFFTCSSYLDKCEAFDGLRLANRIMPPLECWLPLATSMPCPMSRPRLLRDGVVCCLASRGQRQQPNIFPGYKLIAVVICIVINNLHTASTCLAMVAMPLIAHRHSRCSVDAILSAGGLQALAGIASKTGSVSELMSDY